MKITWIVLLIVWCVQGFAQGPVYNFNFYNKETNKPEVTVVPFTETETRRQENESARTVGSFGIVYGVGIIGGGHEHDLFVDEEWRYLEYGDCFRGVVGIKLGLTDNLILNLAYRGFEHSSDFVIDATGAAVGIEYVEHISKIWSMTYGFDFAYMTDSKNSGYLGSHGLERFDKFERMEWRLSTGPQINLSSFFLNLKVGANVIRNNINYDDGTWDNNIALTLDGTASIGFMI